MNEEALKAAVIEAGESEQGVACRTALCESLATAFKRAGEGLWVGGSIIGPERVEGRSPFGFGEDSVVALGTVVQIAGELTAGVVTLLQQNNRYGAAALLRQLVEVEYLTWAFAEEDDDAMNWIRSTREDRMKLWQPRHIQKRAGGRFRGRDYELHCEQGGHPTPAGIHLLPTHHGSRPDFFTWNDLATHGLSAWDYMLSAVDRKGYSTPLRALPEAEALTAARQGWEKDDPLLPLLADAKRFINVP